MKSLVPNKRRYRLAVTLVAPWIMGLLAGQMATAQPSTRDDDAPVSLLPKMFDDAPETVTPAIVPNGAPSIAPMITDAGPDTGSLTVDPFAAPAPVRAIDIAGPLTAAVTGAGAGYGINAFTGANGQGNGAFIAGAMRRIDAPIASRWAHIVLRRALLTASQVPEGVVSADWIAERAWLLLRIGEVDGAKAMVDAVPIDRYSRRLYLVAGQVALAAADLPALCPLAATALSLSPDPMWRLANAMCAGMTGDDITAASEFDRLRDSELVDNFDIVLAERVATLSGTGGRAANVAWEEVTNLSPYRFGLAIAAGITIPPRLLSALPESYDGWVARTAALRYADRAPRMAAAAAKGIISAQEMINFRSAASIGQDRSDFEASPAYPLRAAYVAESASDKLAGMRALWGDDAAHPHYAGLLETALAAAAFPVENRFSSDAPRLIAAMLSAGAVGAAMRWQALAGDQGWAMLAAADPGRKIAVTPDRFDDWMSGNADKSSDNAKHRAALFVAGLDGLHKTGSGWEAIRARVGLADIRNSWTMAIDAAAVAGRVGEVAVLAATALQGPWAAVPPAHFRHLIAALAKVGRGEEARLIVVEALTRS